MSAQLCLYLRSFARRQEATSATEFAFISPILLLLLLMGFDTGRYVLATQRIQEVANSVAEMLSQTASSGNIKAANGSMISIGYVQDSDLHYYWDSAMATFPELLAVANTAGVDWWQLLDVQMTSIEFVASPKGCTTACTYSPNVVWTTGARTCGLTIAPAADTSAYDPSTLPTHVFPVTPNQSIIAVDVSYTFKPTFGAAYMPPINIERSAYMGPRNVSVVGSQSTSLAPQCAGTP